MAEGGRDCRPKESDKKHEEDEDHECDELCLLHHEENFLSQSIHTCEAYEEVAPMAASLAQMCYYCEEEPEAPAELVCACDDGAAHEEEPCDCGGHPGDHENHEGDCVYHCCGCGVQVVPIHEPEDGRRSPLPESLHSDYNRESRTPSPPPLDMDEPNNIPHAFAELPAPPPPPPMAPENSRMTFLNTTMTPMTLLRVLSCEDGSASDTRLHEAARAGDVQRLESLLETLSSNINNKVKPLMATPLRDAVAGGHLDCVKLLLSRGAKVDEVDVKGQTALFCAASRGYADIMEELLQYGANPEGSRLNTCTPLLLCVRDGCTAGVKALLKYGVDPQPVSMLTTCAPGWPLQHAVVYRHYDCFLALLRGGAETSLLKVIEAKMGEVQGNLNIDTSMTRRLSITRTVLRHARETPEFITTFKEFGGVLEPLEFLPADMKSDDCPSLTALKLCLGEPMNLRSLSRMTLCNTFGAKGLEKLIESANLPRILTDYLSFKDC